MSCKLHYEDEVVAVMENAMRLHVPGFLPRQHAEAFTREGYVARPIKDIIWGFGIAYREDRERVGSRVSGLREPGREVLLLALSRALYEVN